MPPQAHDRVLGYQTREGKPSVVSAVNQKHGSLSRPAIVPNGSVMVPRCGGEALSDETCET